MLDQFFMILNNLSVSILGDLFFFFFSQFFRKTKMRELKLTEKFLYLLVYVFICVMIMSCPLPVLRNHLVEVRVFRGPPFSSFKLTEAEIMLEVGHSQVG